MRSETPDTLSIDRTSADPLHRQIEAYLRRQIAEGRLRPGDRIPSIRELSERLNVNHLTIRQALRTLAEEGLVMANQGRGTFVADRRRKTKLHIALMVPNLGMALSSAISRGVQSVAGREEARVSILDLHDDPDILVKHLDALREHGHDGAIVFPLASPAVARALARLILDDYPVVLVDRFMPEIPSWNVVVDNFRGGYLATRHLIENGCRRIAFVSDLECSSTRNRFEGYREALGEGGLVFRRELVREIVPPEDHTRAFVRELLASDQPPDGIFFGNDIRALWGLQETRAAGLRVPDDIQIVGFDDEPASSLVEPALTTVRQDGFEVGRVAAELLCRRMQPGGANEPVTHTIPVELIVRGSTRAGGATAARPARP